MKISMLIIIGEDFPKISERILVMIFIIYLKDAVGSHARIPKYHVFSNSFLIINYYS